VFRTSSVRLAIILISFGDAAIAYGQCPYGWKPSSPVPGADGTLSASTLWDPDGPGPLGSRVVVGGDFWVIGDVTAKNVAMWDGRTWQPFGAGVGAPGFGVGSLAVCNGELIAAGLFSDAGGIPVANIARWDGAQWRPLGSGVSNTVTAMAAYDGSLYVSGEFGFAGGIPVNGNARWDGAAWHAFNGIDGPAEDMVVYQNQLVLAGSFFFPELIDTAEIAAWDGANWHFLVDQLDGSIGALGVHEDALIAGGEFVYLEGVSAQNIARWNGSAWSPLGSGLGGSTTPGMHTWVTSIKSVGSNLYVGGNFATAGGSPAANVAVWSNGAWSGLDGGTDALVDELTLLDGQLLALGRFRQAGGTPAMFASTWDGAHWNRIAPGFGGGRGSTYIGALAVHDGELIAAGTFTSTPDEPAMHIARWNGVRWQALGAGIDGPENSNNSPIIALQSADVQLIVGGHFSEAGGTPAANIAAWDGESWSALGAGLDGSVEALTMYGGSLVAGGAFLTSDGNTLNCIAEWNGTTWAPFGAGFDGHVHHLIVLDGRLYAGGTFTHSGAQVLNRIAIWDGNAWAPLGPGSTSDIRGLTILNERLVAKGRFAVAEGGPLRGVAIWDGNAWHQIGPTPNDNPSGSTMVLGTYRDELIIGGELRDPDFSLVNLQRWDGSQWRSLGGGVSGQSSSSYPISLTTFGDDLIVGGYFTLAGGRAAGCWARWGPLPLAGDINGDSSVDLSDLAILLAHFGTASGALPEQGDTDGDGDIELSDLAALLATFGVACP
jgi:hypothetical protein